jgi:hypothetical protein
MGNMITDRRADGVSLPEKASKRPRRSLAQWTANRLGFRQELRTLVTLI